MSLVQGINHVAIVTVDLDRLTAFYCATFDVALVQVDDTPFGRIGIIKLGPGVALNIFEITGNDHAAGLSAMFDRGHLDHLGLDVIDETAFATLRDRLVAGGYSTGQITNFGPVLGLDFTDPDGMSCEINLVVDPTLAGGHPPTPHQSLKGAIT